MYYSLGGREESNSTSVQYQLGNWGSAEHLIYSLGSIFPPQGHERLTSKDRLIILDQPCSGHYCFLLFGFPLFEPKACGQPSVSGRPESAGIGLGVPEFLSIL